VCLPIPPLPQCCIFYILSQLISLYREPDLNRHVPCETQDFKSAQIYCFFRFLQNFAESFSSYHPLSPPVWQKKTINNMVMMAVHLHRLKENLYIAVRSIFIIQLICPQPKRSVQSYPPEPPI
jgi:hypothetical protein